ncbi:MAG TPA: class I SAM-dependent methyltransferase [Myxococcota bacterium]|nr:class I SAM-dependent methyltransferase [Myxococcota bacterium]
MSDEANRYDVVRYPTRAYAHAHPDRLWVLGTLFGMRPALPEDASILELGCGEGGHLLPIAARSPRSRCVGVDLAQSAVAEARRRAAQAGLTNTTFVEADLAALPADLGTFDYIICHGVFSWVPEPARQGILAACRRHLSPHGIAYVSYNALPGWHLLRVGREIMRYHGTQFEDPIEQARQGMAMVRFMADQVGDSDAPYARVLKQQAEMTRHYSDAYYFHDYLAPDNEPLLFRDFVARARPHGLAYLGDADLGVMMPANVPRELRATLDRISPDIVAVEQYLDLIRGTSFRRTLLVHEEVELKRELSGADLREMYVSLCGRPREAHVDLTTEEPAVFDAYGDVAVTVHDRLGKAGLLRLAALHPRALAWGELVELSRTWAGLPADAEAEERRLGGTLLHAYGAGLVDLAPRDRGAVGQVSERPIGDLWARLLAADGEASVPNVRHEAVPLVRMDQVLLVALDGTRTVAELEDELVAAGLDGRLTIKVAGEESRDPGVIREAIRAALPDRLQRLLRTSLLVG